MPKTGLFEAYKQELRRLIESAYSPERLVLQLLWNNLIDIGQAKGLREDIASLEAHSHMFMAVSIGGDNRYPIYPGA